MYDEIKSDHHPHHATNTPRSSIPAFCPKYSANFSIASVHSIDHHTDHSDHDLNNHDQIIAIHANYDSDYQQHESMLHQLSAFGYNPKEIQDAMEHVSNPSDINEIVEYMSAKDMHKLSHPDLSDFGSVKSFKVKPLNQWK